MCGRYRQTKPVDEMRDLRRFFRNPPPNFEPRYNAAPTQRLPIVRRGDDGAGVLELRHWGLIPAWARDRKIAAQTINARAETVAEKPSFRVAFKSRRCLVAADGWYEWVGPPKAKQPYMFTIDGGAPFAFAGLFESWTDPASKEKVETFNIVTTEPNAVANVVHDRMPVVLPAARYDAWLDAATPPAELLAMLAPRDIEGLGYVPVSRAALADRSDRNRPDCIVPIASSAAHPAP